jgi:hypothetical protein
VVTSLARSAPVIGGLASTRRSSAAGSPVCGLIAARIAPRSRRCSVSARVPVIAIAVMPCATSSSARVRFARQLDARMAGSRITKPLTQIRRDSLSSSLMPVLPICGAVIATICRWYDGSVSVSW